MIDAKKKQFLTGRYILYVKRFKDNFNKTWGWKVEAEDMVLYQKGMPPVTRTVSRHSKKSLAESELSELLEASNSRAA